MSHSMATVLRSVMLGLLLVDIAGSLPGLEHNLASPCAELPSNPAMMDLVLMTWVILVAVSVMKSWTELKKSLFLYLREVAYDSVWCQPFLMEILFVNLQRIIFWACNRTETEPSIPSIPSTSSNQSTLVSVMDDVEWHTLGNVVTVAARYSEK